MDIQLNPYEFACSQANDPEKREAYWNEYAQKVEWVKQASKVLDESNPPHYRWFKDAQLNMCYNCVDRHAESIPDQKALLYESPITQSCKEFTWRELQQNVARLAGAVQSLGIKKGDTAIIYMPMVPEAIFAMMACARLGVTHSVVFGGFAAKELRSRIDDCQPTIVFSASCGLEPNKIVDYKQILDEALSTSKVASSVQCIILQRSMKTCSLVEKRDHDYYEITKNAQNADCVPVEGEHPLYILYTSGTTGVPKGIVRDTGGTAVALTWTMEHIMGIQKGDVYFSGSDIGWVVGHSFIVYGPLVVGATTVLFEGKPVGTPDPGVYWNIIEKHKVKGMYTAPTALRVLRKEDLDGKWKNKYDTSSLQAISMAGERCDIPTFEWIQNLFPGKLINDNYWQTECGWIISCNTNNLHRFPTKPGAATKPMPGFRIEILDEQNNPQPQGQLGRICIKLPMPPSFMLGLWGNTEAFVHKYLADSPGYYTSGDAGYFDNDGYLHVMTRLDDIINTAGHRLSTAEMEEVLLGHPSIVEAAVIGAKDELRGEIPIGFVVIKKGLTVNEQELEKELAALIRRDIGPVAAYRITMVVDKLPKTRSGKVLRMILKKICDCSPFNIPPTIDDADVLPPIQETVRQRGLGKVQNIVFEEDIKN